MIKTIRVMLLPNNRHKTKLFQYAGAARFAYNWALNREQENYKNGGKFISDGDLRKEFTRLKKKEEYSWLNGVSNNVAKPTKNAFTKSILSSPILFCFQLQHHEQFLEW